MAEGIVNGIKLYYERHGDSGDPLVLVHGYTGDHTDWELQIKEFSPSYRVLVMDLRGHGRSEAPSDRSTYTIEQMASDVEQLIDQVGFERYHLVGHSMGGAVVQEIALRSPQKLLSLTLHDTTCFWGVERADLETALAEAWKKRLELAHDKGMAAALAVPVDLPKPYMPPERVRLQEERLLHMSVDGFIGAITGLSFWKGTLDRAHNIRASTLIIYGEGDGETIIDGSQKLAKLIPNATEIVVPEAMHSPNWERPELYNEALRRHLEANPVKAG